MRYWRPITNKDLSIAGLTAVSWVVLLLMWAFVDYSTAEYIIVPCADDICNVLRINGIKSICFAEFTTIPGTGICGVDCPENFDSPESASATTSPNTTLPCNYDKSTKCPILVCRKYTSQAVGMFFALVSLTIIIAGATLAIVVVETTGWYMERNSANG